MDDAGLGLVSGDLDLNVGEVQLSLGLKALLKPLLIGILDLLELLPHGVLDVHAARFGHLRTYSVVADLLLFVEDLRDVVVDVKFTHPLL